MSSPETPETKQPPSFGPSDDRSWFYRLELPRALAHVVMIGVWAIDDFAYNHDLFVSIAFGLCVVWEILRRIWPVFNDLPLVRYTLRKKEKRSALTPATFLPGRPDGFDQVFRAGNRAHRDLGDRVRGPGRAHRRKNLGREQHLEVPQNLRRFGGLRGNYIPGRLRVALLLWRRGVGIRVDVAGRGAGVRRARRRRGGHHPLHPADADGRQPSGCSSSAARASIGCARSRCECRNVAFRYFAGCVALACPVVASFHCSSTSRETALLLRELFVSRGDRRVDPLESLGRPTVRPRAMPRPGRPAGAFRRSSPRATHATARRAAHARVSVRGKFYGTRFPSR